MELSDYRARIDQIDRQLVELFAQRMNTAAGIAAYKKEHGLPVLDPVREREKLLDVAAQAPEDMRDYTASLYTMLFELSRCYQGRLLGSTSPLTTEIQAAIDQTPNLFPSNVSVACQGVAGAYSQLACDKLFKLPHIMYFASFEAVFAAIERGLCRYGLLPLENSTAGSVNAIYDLMMKHDFRIVRSVRLKVDHNLLVKPGTKRSDITEIYSHQQALSQCEQYLQAFPGVKIIPCENTAVAAQKVAEGDGHAAALSSRSCMKLYGLERERGAGSGQQLHPVHLHLQESGDLPRCGPHQPHGGAASRARLPVPGALPVLRPGPEPEQAGKPPHAGAEF